MSERNTDTYVAGLYECGHATTLNRDQVEIIENLQNAKAAVIACPKCSNVNTRTKLKEIIPIANVPWASEFV